MSLTQIDPLTVFGLDGPIVVRPGDRYSDVEQLRESRQPNKLYNDAARGVVHLVVPATPTRFDDLALDQIEDLETADRMFVSMLSDENPDGTSYRFRAVS